jgi:XRE family transcriptional regulator of biofilm formation
MEDKTLGEFVRESRKRSKMSLDELAKRARISKTYLFNIERDRRGPSDPVLRRISNVLGVPIERLNERNAMSALIEFRKLIERDRELYLAFVGLMKNFKNGAANAEVLRSKLSVR